MKRFIAIVMVILTAAMLFGCSRGDTGSVRRIIGDSEVHSDLEIEKAMKTVMVQFQKNFSGCTLLALEYDDAVQNEDEDSIVLLSSFYVDETGGDGSLNSDYTYQNYQWVLTRSWWGGWKIVDTGYA